MQRGEQTHIRSRADGWPVPSSATSSRKPTAASATVRSAVACTATYRRNPIPLLQVEATRPSELYSEAYLNLLHV